MNYAVSPQAYLSRARDRLLSGTAEDLFYAAFELRCCVEQRQSDYLEAVDWFEGQKIKAWRVGETAKKLQKLWRNPQIAQLTYQFGDVVIPTFFTPVSAKLVRATERTLAPLLHSQRDRGKGTQRWLQETREHLEAIYREAWVACRGEHMAPPLWDLDSKEVHPTKLYASPKTAGLILHLLRTQQNGRLFKLRVDYLGKPPVEWISDV